jgi:hypothetical protein
MHCVCVFVGAGNLGPGKKGELIALLALITNFSHLSSCQFQVSSGKLTFLRGQQAIEISILE